MTRTPKKSDDSDAFADQDEILLGVLNAIDRDARTSQRSISSGAWCRARACQRVSETLRRQGLDQGQPGARRGATPIISRRTDLPRKTRLTAEYFSYSFTFLPHGRANRCHTLMAQCAADGRSRIAFAGASELAEVGTLCAHDYPVKLMPASSTSKRAGESLSAAFLLRATLAELGEVDVVIVTGIPGSETIVRAMEIEVGRERVLLPALARNRGAHVPTAAGAGVRAAE